MLNNTSLITNSSYVGSTSFTLRGSDNYRGKELINAKRMVGLTKTISRGVNRGVNEIFSKYSRDEIFSKYSGDIIETKVLDVVRDKYYVHPTYVFMKRLFELENKYGVRSSDMYRFYKSGALNLDTERAEWVKIYSYFFDR